MATYNTAFGSLPGYNEMLGTTNTTGGGQQQVYGQRAQQQRQQQQAPAPSQTFAQMQRQGMARPAPVQGPQAQAFGQYGGSQQAQQMRQRLQEQLQSFGNQPSRFDTQAFQQIRGAQQANIQAEFQEQQRQLNEDLARRGLSASNIAASGLGRLGGAQARALADIDAQLLQRAAETQAQDRAQLLAASQGLAELAGSQDLQQFEANRVAQAATFENQLRAAQFGQQQYETAGQEAFQAAQAEEAAQQAARQFDLAATGQAAGLSLDLQRLLGQQEVERAQLTGQLGGQQTLAAQQQAEQRRQFDIQQALQQQLGLGGLSLQEREQAAREQQFGITTAEQRRQFDIQQALQQQLGLGGLDVQRGELSVRQQQLQQQATDSAAERALREKLQTQELTAQEAQQLRDIDARKFLQTQQLKQEAEQFGLNLNEQQAARLQQGGFTSQELALKTRQLEQESALRGRELNIEEAKNLAINSLERDKINQQALQFGLTLSENKEARLQQLGISREELSLEAQKIRNQAEQFGQTLSAQQIQNQAQNNLEKMRIDQVTFENAQQRNLQSSLQAQELSNRLTSLLMQRETQFGLADADAALRKDLQRMASESELTRLERQLLAQREEGTAQRDLQKLLTGRELDIRRELGMGEIGVQQISALAQQELARNQLFTQLATLLKSLGAGS